MADNVPLPHAEYTSPGDLANVWNVFRAGGLVRCGKDSAHLALTVNAAVGAYRFVCTHCGASSPWFAASGDGLRSRGYSEEPGPIPPDDD